MALSLVSHLEVCQTCFCSVSSLVLPWYVRTIRRDPCGYKRNTKFRIMRCPLEHPARERLILTGIVSSCLRLG